MSNRKNVITHWLMPTVGAIAVGGLFLYWQWPSPPEASQTQADGRDSVPAKSLSSADIAQLYSQESTVTDSVATDQPASTPEPLSSAIFVALHASREGDEIHIELNVDKHWHINANPASFDFPIPTEVEIAAKGARLPINLDYPLGHPIAVGLDKPIRVYSGRTSLIANLPEQGRGGPLRIKAQVQACNDSGLCLPPSTI